MAKIKVHAGDFEGTIKYSLGTFYVPHVIGGTEKIGVRELELVEPASEENVKKLGGTLGWGAAGAAVLGPVGLLAGLLLGGRKKEVTFVARFKDGRKMLATTDSKTFKELMAAVF